MAALYQFSFCFALNKPKIVESQNQDWQRIRILTWNIQGFRGNKNISENDLVKKASDIIQKYSPEIICFQEYRESKSLVKMTEISNIKKKYPNFYYYPDYIAKNNTQLGCAIFSTLPIKKIQRISLPNSESFLTIIVEKNKQEFMIANTHLQSYKFKDRDFETFKNVSKNNHYTLGEIYSVLKKIYRANTQRYKQVDFINKVIEKIKIPIIFCGDLNDVPNSYTYSNLKKNLFQDAFLSTNFGFGTTYFTFANYISFLNTLRIDYIFFTKQFSAQKTVVLRSNLSDHYPLIADLKLKSL